MPSPETPAEADLFDALTVVFLVPMKSAEARAAVRHAVGDRFFELLTAFLAFVRTAHYWTETHPELAYEPDVAALMAAHPELAGVLLDTKEADDAAQDSALRQALETSETAPRESEARHRLLIESWAQAVWETDPEGVVIADSPSWRTYTGQTLNEWLGYGWLDAIHLEDRAYAERQWREAMAAKTLVNAEFRLRSPDGGWRWTDVRAAPVLDEGGRIEKWVGMNVDIKARKRIEHALQASEERQAFLLGLSDALSPLQDATTIMRKATRMLGEALGANRVFYASVDAGGVAEAAGTYSLAEFAPHLLPEWRAGRASVVADIDADPRYTDAQRAAFASVAARAAVGVPLVKEGRLVTLFGVNHATPRDWTDTEIALIAETAERTWAAVERERAEASLRDSEARFREFGENSCDALWIVDAERMQLEYLSPAFERIWGENRDAIMADVGRWAELIHPEDREQARAAMPRLLAGEPFVAEYRIVRPDGEVRWIRDAGFPIRVGEVVKRGGGIAQDVTELRRSQAALRESEERFRQFGEASQDALWVRDAETFQWEYLTPAFETIYGLNRETALRGDNFANWTDLIVPEDRARAVANLERVRDGEWKTFEYRIRRPSDGRVRWLRNTDFPMRNASGAVQRIGGVGHDITELKRTGEALAAAELRQRALIEGMPQLVWRAVDGGEWTWASPQWTEFTGQAGADSQGWGWLEALHPNDRDAARAAWDEATDRGGLDAEYRVCHSEEGGYRWFHTRASPVRNDRGDIVEWLGTSTDIHDLREMQERQGVLVAELQHRTRNLMGVVRSMSDKTARASTDLPDFFASASAIDWTRWRAFRAYCPV